MSESKDIFIVKYGEQDDCGRVAFMDVETKAFDDRESAEKFVSNYAKAWFERHMPDLCEDINFDSTEAIADELIGLEDEGIPSFEFEIIDPIDNDE